MGIDSYTLSNGQSRFKGQLDSYYGSGFLSAAVEIKILTKSNVRKEGFIPF